MTKKVKILLSCSLMILIISMCAPADATEVKGYLNTGVWYLKNDLTSNPLYTPSDGYGRSYVQDSFAMANASLDLNFLHMNNPDSNVDTSIHLKGRGLYNILDHAYTLSPYDQYRYQADEANIEFDFGSTNLWMGRHTIYEAGGVGVDGITSLFDTSEHFGVGLYGGLGNDPRTLTGYIGPTYKTVPFTADFLAGGMFTKYHSDIFQMDTGINTLLFKRKVDRSNFYTQFFWNATPVWAFSGFADIGFMGDVGLQKGMLAITTKVTPKLKNRFSFSEFRSLFYKRSDASAIAIAGSFDPSFIIGTSVDTSEYYAARDEIEYRFDQNYIFTGMEFGRRTFDHRNRMKYFMGYFDPEIFGSKYDFRIETNIIDNYVSFNTSIDVMLGRDFANEKFRTEVGGTFYANERDQFENGVIVAPGGQVEKETTARANFQWNTTHSLSWFLNYAYHREVEAFNLNQKVHTHEVYLSSNIRF